MIDPFAVVGERVRYWSEINNPKDGKGTYVPSKSSMRIHQQDIIFGEVLPGEITPDSVYHASWENNTSVQGTQNFTVNESTTDSFTWTVKEGLEVSTKFQAKIPFVGSAESSIEMSLESTQSETHTTTKGWIYATQVLVPPRSKVVSSFIVNQAKYDVSFTARVVVRGKVHIKFQSGRFFEQEIDVLINDAGWSESTFKVHTTGMMEGVVGESFTVRTDEYALDGTPVALTNVVDRGFWADGKIVSVPALALLQSV
jgi:hypothetical protein